MFFAETLGPALTASSAAALTKFVQDKLGRQSVSPAELRATIADFLRISNNPTAPDAVIKFLTSRGIASPDGANFRIGA